MPAQVTRQRLRMLPRTLLPLLCCSLVLAGSSDYDAKRDKMVRTQIEARGISICYSGSTHSS